MENSAVYTAKEVAEIFKTTVNTIYVWERQGKINAIPNMRPMRFSKKEIDEILNRKPISATIRERELEMENKKLKRELANLHTQVKATISRLLERI